MPTIKIFAIFAHGKNKTIVVFVALLLLALFPSCGGDGGEDTKPPENGGGNVPDEVETYEGETEKRMSFDLLPAADYGGAKFVVANMEGYTWTDVTLEVEAENTGEMLNDAIYKRNRLVEEKYNVALEVVGVPYGTMANKVRNQMRADDCLYDIMQMPMGFDVMPLTTENYIADAKKLEKLDLANPWWDAFAHESTSIAGRQFFLFGDFTIADKEYATVIFLNRSMQQEYGLPNFYQMVYDGIWTIDKMLESMKAVTKDLDGDGKWTKEDQYGFVVNYHSATMTFYGAGETMVKKDAGDIPYWTVNTESFINAFMKMCEFMNTDNTTIDAFKVGSHQDTMFAEGKALFDSTLLSVVRTPEGGTQSMRDVEQWDFGILPPPKLDERQERYYSLMDGEYSPCVAIINHEPARLERAAVILEALNAKSSEEVQPKYKEYALPLKFIRDEESFDMVDIILKNRIFDLAGTYNWGTMNDKLKDHISENKTDRFVSFIEQNIDKAESESKRDIELIMNLK